MVATAKNTLALSDEFRRLSNPVIIIGMHRSGTSLVAGLLHILGVYVDPELSQQDNAEILSVPSSIARQNGYGEATSFRLLNEEIMAQSGANWDNVLPFMAVRDQLIYAQRSVEAIVRASHSTLKQDYLSSLPENYSGHWGWKDPRNSLTLPYWLEVFPSAYLLHVTREVEGVVKSLMTRAQAQSQEVKTVRGGLLKRLEQAVYDPQAAVRAVQRRLFKDTKKVFPRFSMLDREDCIRLSDIYFCECMRYSQSEYNYAEISYEEIIAAPELSIRKIVEMLQLEAGEAAIIQAVKFVSRP